MSETKAPHRGHGEDGIYLDAARNRYMGAALAANVASRRVMEKAGLTLVKTFHQPWPHAVGGHDLEVVEYALRKADWEQRERDSAGAAPQG